MSFLPFIASLSLSGDYADPQLLTRDQASEPLACSTQHVDRLVKDITSEDIRRLRSWLQKKGLAEATWLKKLSRLKTVLNSAVKQKLLDENC